MLNVMFMLGALMVIVFEVLFQIKRAFCLICSAYLTNRGMDNTSIVVSTCFGRIAFSNVIVSTLGFGIVQNLDCIRRPKLQHQSILLFPLGLNLMIDCANRGIRCCTLAKTATRLGTCTMGQRLD